MLGGLMTEPSAAANHHHSEFQKQPMLNLTAS